MALHGSGLDNVLRYLTCPPEIGVDGVIDLTLRPFKSSYPTSVKLRLNIQSGEPEKQFWHHEVIVTHVNVDKNSWPMYRGC